MSTWVFDFALINDFPPPNWGHFPLLWVFQVEIWESYVFFCKESQTIFTWPIGFALINDFPPQIGVISLWFGASSWIYEKESQT